MKNCEDCKKITGGFCWKHNSSVAFVSSEINYEDWLKKNWYKQVLKMVNTNGEILGLCSPFEWYTTTIGY